MEYFHVIFSCNHEKFSYIHLEHIHVKVVCEYMYEYAYMNIYVSCIDSSINSSTIDGILTWTP